MIREMLLEDYEEVKELFYEVHNLHLENRPDIYRWQSITTKIF